MNFTNEKVTGINSITVSDSLKCPLLKFSLSCNANTVLPDTNEIIIYIDRSMEVTSERLEYTYLLSSSLKYLNGVSDEFVIEPNFSGNKVKMKAYVKRRIKDNQILDNYEIEELPYEMILLLEGSNVICSNYSNASLEVIYPKNEDLIKYFINTSIFNEHEKNQEEITLDDLYFKDAFTKVDEKINLEVNNLEVSCISSSNNKFQLDSDGNLVVNSITSASGSNSVSFDTIYPVGSIYLSTNSVNPSILFGGSWTQIEDKFLLACSNNHPAGEIGGEEAHQLTVNEMPAHNHIASTNETGAHSHSISTWYNGTSGTAQTMEGWGTKKHEKYHYTGNNGAHSHTVTINNTGSGLSHNNMPPYLAIYAFKRIL